MASQRWDGALGLYDYRARCYGPALGRFISADPLVPEPGNPQALNRYLFVYGNPLKYTDPSGHDPLDAQWEAAFYAVHGRNPTVHDKRDRLFSLIFLGDGPNGEWTDENWAFYAANRDGLWSGDVSWPGAEAPGLNRFVKHIDRLASYYSLGEERQFAQAVGFVWGGIPLGRPAVAAYRMATNPNVAWSVFNPLYEGTDGWASIWVDDENPSHHYAGLFFTGYFFGSVPGKIANWLRDGPLSNQSDPDLALGYVASDHGAALRNYRMSLNEVGLAAKYALTMEPGIWPMDTPGRRVR